MFTERLIRVSSHVMALNVFRPRHTTLPLIQHAEWAKMQTREDLCQQGGTHYKNSGDKCSPTAKQ